MHQKTSSQSNNLCILPQMGKITKMILKKQINRDPLGNVTDHFGDVEN